MNNECGSKCKSAAGLSDWETRCPADSSCYGDVYNDCNRVAPFDLQKLWKTKKMIFQQIKFKRQIRKPLHLPPQSTTIYQL